MSCSRRSLFYIFTTYQNHRDPVFFIYHCYQLKRKYPFSCSAKKESNQNETPYYFPYLPPPYHQVSTSHHQPEIFLDLPIPRLILLSAIPLNPQPLPPGVYRVGKVSERAALNPQPLPPGIERVNKRNMLDA